MHQVIFLSKIGTILNDFEWLGPNLIQVIFVSSNQLSPESTSVQGVSQSAVILDVAVVGSCPGNPPCSGSGSCQFTDILNPTCQCASGFSGVDCSQQVSSQKNNDTIYIIIGVVVGVALLICCVIIIVLMPKGRRRILDDNPVDLEEVLRQRKEIEKRILPRSPSMMTLEGELGEYKIDYMELTVKKKIGRGAFGIGLQIWMCFVVVDYFV